MLAALGFTIDNILVRKGLMEENHGSIWDIRFLVSLSALSFFVLGILVAALFGFDILSEFRALTHLEVLYLMISGILGPLIGALLFTSAIGQIGASHASALWGGSNPLFTTLLAFVLLGEVPGLVGVLSVLTIVGGIVVVGYHGHEGTIVLVEKTKLAGGVIALLSGLCVSLSQIGRGAAINLGATPNTAFFVFQATSLLIVALVCLAKSRNFKYIAAINRKSLTCYIIAGMAISVGAYCLLTAFTLIPLWQAVAIRNVQPILVVILSWFFLKQSDRISFRLAAGAALVTVGVAVLNIY